MARKNDIPDGYGRILESWSPPEQSGAPVGCLATTFTLSPAFFEEACLARFLQLESDPDEDGLVYLLEREEKLAQISCAAVLVDEQHGAGLRSLRWDLLCVRGRRQHAKVSLLVWSEWVRVIIASSNLTEDGYRRNQEIFGVLDYHPACESPRDTLFHILDFLDRLTEATQAQATTPVQRRITSLLNHVRQRSEAWGLAENPARSPSRVYALFTGKDYPDILREMDRCWPTSVPPSLAEVVSPFFNPPDSPNEPAQRLWGLLRQRGEAEIRWNVIAQQRSDGTGFNVQAPRSLLAAQPARASASTKVYRVVLDDHRPLHAKMIWLEEAERWTMCMIGSSNFTSAGLGISHTANWEANLLYVVDRSAYKQLHQAFPKHEELNIDNLTWQTESGDEGESGFLPTLPEAFESALFVLDTQDRPQVQLTFRPPITETWELLTHDYQPFCNLAMWQEAGQPKTYVIPWSHSQPPAGFWVRSTAYEGLAWWPVNIDGPQVLPPPDELKNLSLDILLTILSSARPLHRVLAEHERRKQPAETTVTVIDPHQRVDTTSFLLPRIRRMLWAFHALRERLERPVATIESLRWRLVGPVSVRTLAEAIHREATSNGERLFLIAELILELHRVRPTTADGCLSVSECHTAIRNMIDELQLQIPTSTADEPTNLRQYVERVLTEVAR